MLLEMAEMGPVTGLNDPGRVQLLQARLCVLMVLLLLHVLCGSTETSAVMGSSTKGRQVDRL